MSHMIQKIRMIRTTRMSRSTLALCLALCWGAGLTGCGAYKVGLRESLEPPPMHNPKVVKKQRSEWDKAKEIYHKRHLSVRARMLVRGYQDRDSGLKSHFIIRGAHTPVHWRELLEVSGHEKLAKKLYQRRRAINMTMGSVSLVFALAGLGVGGAMLGLALTEPKTPLPGTTNQPNMVLFGGGIAVASVGLIATIATFWGYTGTFGVEPTPIQVKTAVTGYNKKLTRALGLHQKAPAYPLVDMPPMRR